LQLFGLAVGLHQRGDVLALVRARQGQDQRLLRLLQEALQLLLDRRLLLAAVRRVEALQVGARRDHRHALGLVVVVEAVLLLDLLGGAGDHQAGRAQGLLLGVDAPGHVVALVDDGAALDPEAISRRRLTRPREWPVCTSGTPSWADIRAPT
jgi:hypothetical protein